MIKVTVHESVEAALQRAFPKPASSAKKALAKYVAVIESLLFDALQHGRTPEQDKLGLYSVSMEKLGWQTADIGIDHDRPLLADSCRWSQRLD